MDTEEKTVIDDPELSTEYQTEIVATPDETEQVYGSTHEIDDNATVSNDGNEIVASKKKRRRKKFYEYTLDNDIKYRGPLSYRDLKILAWIFLIVAQVGVILKLGAKFDTGLASKVGFLPEILKYGSNLMMPLFLIATFGTILNGSRSFKSMLFVYGGAAVVFYILFVLFHERYIPTIAGWVMGIERAEAVKMIDGILSSALKNGYLAFNIFIDLFLCALLIFFTVYKPKKVFTGKKEIIFRAFSLIPIGYEVASFVLKMLAAFGKVTISSYLYPLLTTKPPMTFVLFLIIAIFIKVREHRFIKVGKTYEEYQTFLQTKANSWHFSRFTAVMMVLISLIDAIVYFVLSIVLVSNGIDPNGSEEAINTTIQQATQAMLDTGVGGSLALLMGAPIVTLFSYNRVPKKSIIDTLLPLIAIIVLMFVYLEAAVIATGLIGPFADFVGKVIH